MICSSFSKCFNVLQNWSNSMKTLASSYNMSSKCLVASCVMHFSSILCLKKARGWNFCNKKCEYFWSNFMYLFFSAESRNLWCLPLISFFFFLLEIFQINIFTIILDDVSFFCLSKHWLRCQVSPHYFVWV